MQFLSKFQGHFYRIKKKPLKFIWNLKGHKTAKTIFRKQNKAGGLTLADFKVYYKATTFKTL